MAGRRVHVADDVQRIIAKLHPETKRKVRAAIDAIAAGPTVGEPLEQELTGFRRIRVGTWRIVYRQERAAIQIHAVGRRATVYSELVARLERPLRERRRPYRRSERVSVPKRRGGSRDRAQ